MGSLFSSEKTCRKLAQLAGVDIDSDIKIHNPNFYSRVFAQENLGLGESYVEGWWDANQKLDRLFFLACRAQLKQKLASWSIWAKFHLFLTWLWLYLFPIKTPEQSKAVAVKHYDLGNELFYHMLGQPMTYSCAYYTKSNQTLPEAQLAKMDRIREKLKLKPGMRVLDIGSGWGELVNYLAIEAEVKVDGITISEEQYDYAQKHKVEGANFHLVDYRHFHPAYDYDAIVSVGMFEHVNSENYREFMEIVNGLLKPEGIFLLHTIGSGKSVIAADRWINKYIFPNSCLPSLAQIAKASEDLLVVEDVDNFGLSYDRTLMAWYENFVQNFDEINKVRVQLGKSILDNKFFRMWSYYLLSCAGSFRARRIHLYQVVLTKEPLSLYKRVA